MRGIRPSSRSQNEQPKAPTVVSSGTKIVGNLHSREDLVIAGSFHGDINTTRSLHLTPEAVVQGDIHAAEALVAGEVHGSILADKRVEIRSGAVVSGEVRAPQVRVHEGVVLNASVRMSAPAAKSKHYLLPALLTTSGGTANEKNLRAAGRAAEHFLQSLGFDVEARPGSLEKSGTLRPIFRSRVPLVYDGLRQRLLQASQVLQSVSGSSDEEPLQGTGADGARDLLNAMGRLRDATLMLGPVMMKSAAAKPGGVSIQVQTEGLPEAHADHDPSQLLIDLQRIQTEMMNEQSGERLKKT